MFTLTHRIADDREADEVREEGIGFPEAREHAPAAGLARFARAMPRPGSITPGPIRVVLRRGASYDSAMTEAIAFDTRCFVKRLPETGITGTPAGEHAAPLNGNLAAGAQARIKTLGPMAEAHNAKPGAGLPEWMSGAMIAQGGLIFAPVMLL